MSLLKEVRLDNTEKVLELLQSVQDLNQVDPKTGNSLLHLAIKNQNAEILKGLLQSRNFISPINPNILNIKDGLPPLIAALNMNFTDGATLLLQHKADPKFTLPDGRSIMHFAVTCNTGQTIHQLLKYGVPINTLALCGTPLHDAISFGQVENALFLLEQPDIDINGQDEDGDSLFHLCASEGAGDILNAIINKIKSNKAQHKQAMALINSLNRDGNAPLHIAALNQRSLILQLLTESAEALEIDLQMKNKAGLTYSVIQKDLSRKDIMEKEDMVLRKKEAQEEKNKRGIQQRQEMIEQSEREQANKKNSHQNQRVKSQEGQNKSMVKNIICGLIIGLVLASVYMGFDLAIKNKSHHNILD